MASQQAKQLSVLTLSTTAFTLCFAVWVMFAIIGIPIKAELGLTETQFGLLASTPVLTVLLGFFMSLGKAAVYKHIPVYYPNHVGSVGGLVGMIGGLGGFFLPITFGIVLDLTGVWTTSYMVMFVLVAVSLVWMHMAIRRMERRRIPELSEEGYRYLPEVQESTGGNRRKTGETDART
ncbi:hypothetical protein [Chromohalobacter japonicus]|uniref:MFS transporter n=1 Tax=Chromohalobacter japonicus TaxID=223900 RepID=UPI003F8FB6E4